MGTINISLPDSLEGFVDDQVSQRGFGSSSEYVRELIRKDQDRAQTRSLLLEGVTSPAAPAADQSRFDDLRKKAAQDIDQSIAYYCLPEKSENTALGFVGTPDQGLAHIGRYPHSGATFYDHGLNWPDLKSWPLQRYPYLVFYIEFFT